MVDRGRAQDVNETARRFAETLADSYRLVYGQAAEDEERQQQRAQWQAFFRSYDVVLTPVSPVAAIVHDHSDSRTITVNGATRPYQDQSIWTGLAGGVYLPAAAVPVGLTRGGLPVAMQVIAPYLEDRTAVDIARHLERTLGGFQAPPFP